MLQKRASEKFKRKFDFAHQILQIFSLFKYLWATPPGCDLFWSLWKMSPKMSDFSLPYFPDNYLIFYWFILHIWQQKRIWLIAFLTNLWYSSMTYMMETWQPSIINRDVENLFVSASGHRIILWNLSFRMYLHVY